MQKKWFILLLVVLMYLPVSMDATILHIAIPTLSMQLQASGNELLWIIDIYSLVMAGLLLPMGSLGDRLGYKKLSIIGLTIFGLASVLAALSYTPAMLIISRAIMAIGASMILPATLSCLRITFPDQTERNIALGIWASIGVGAAAIGPLAGGYLLEHFYWGTVFLINIPIVIMVLLAIILTIPQQHQNPQQKWAIGKALILTIAILALVYALKSGLRGEQSIFITLLIALSSIIALIVFVKSELNSASPMIDFHLLGKRVISIGVVIAMTVMIAIVGFELLIAQELQFVHQLSPLKAGIYMLPLMLASGLSGPIAGYLSSKLGIRLIATVSMGIATLSFLGLAMCNFITDSYIVWALMTTLGFSLGTALTTSTMAIMSAAPPEKSASAGAIESMAYELGAGFGIVIFGILLTSIYAYTIDLPPNLPMDLVAQASASINEAYLVAEQLSELTLSQNLITAANNAFTGAHKTVLFTAGILLTLLTYFIWRYYPVGLKTSTQHH